MVVRWSPTCNVSRPLIRLALLTDGARQLWRAHTHTHTHTMGGSLLQMTFAVIHVVVCMCCIVLASPSHLALSANRRWRRLIVKPARKTSLSMFQSFFSCEFMLHPVLALCINCTVPYVAIYHFIFLLLNSL